MIGLYTVCDWFLHGISWQDLLREQTEYETEQQRVRTPSSPTTPNGLTPTSSGQIRAPIPRTSRGQSREDSPVRSNDGSAVEPVKEKGLIQKRTEVIERLNPMRQKAKIITRNFGSSSGGKADEATTGDLSVMATQAQNPHNQARVCGLSEEFSEKFSLRSFQR
jgi:hypothetical protein